MFVDLQICQLELPHEALELKAIPIKQDTDDTSDLNLKPKSHDCFGKSKVLEKSKIIKLFIDVCQFVS